MINRLKQVYSENTIVGIALTALAIFFGQVIFPEQVKGLIEYLIPLFIIVACLEILFIRENLKKFNCDSEFEYNSFNSGEEFDNYLANRFKTANSVKVLHVDAQTIPKRENRRYYDIADDFIKSGKSFRRIFSDTSNADVYQWMQEDLEKFQKDRYFAHLLDKVTIHNIRTIGIMLIDDEEVCLGGGYVTSFKHPTISIKHPDIVKFFSDYFDYLRDNSINLKTDEKINMDILEERINNLPT
ncbi:MAG: hypothetical protein ACL93V_03645 [Candidatus Electrothrix sp. YB6]